MRDTAAATPGGGVRETFSVARDTVQLAACLTLPPGDAPFPCVVFAHGAGCRKESLHATLIGRRLIEAGIATLMFDFSGEGESGNDPHEGDEAHVEDLEAVFKWARARPEIDVTQMAVAATGIGALAAVRAVRRRLVRPEAVVLVGPEVESCGFVSVSPPSLAIVGADDPALSRIRTLVDWSDTVTLTVVPGAGAAFEEAHALENAAALAIAWLNARLAGGEALEADTGGGD